MKKGMLVAVFILILVQFAVVGSLIFSREVILQKGELFRFLTQPIDPVDPFQGRYVSLRIAEDSVPCEEDQVSGLERGDVLYAMLQTNDAGFAHFSSWSLTLPETGSYLKTKYVHRQDSGVHIEIPFKRFYMDETKAPRAERLAAHASRNTNCWVDVRIYHGEAAIEDVFAEGKSLSELVAGK